MWTIRTGNIIPFRRPASSVSIPGFQQNPHLRLVVSNNNSQETLFARLEESRKAHKEQTQKAHTLWSVQTFTTVDEILYADCLVGIGQIHGQGIAGYETVKEIIQGCTILEDITELLVAADNEGYRGAFRYAEGTTLLIEYKQWTDRWTLWKYNKDTKATSQVQALQGKEPKINDEQRRRNSVTEDLGVLIRTNDEKIYASLCVERKKPGIYSPPLQRTYATVDQAIKDFQEYIPLNIETMFPNPKEKKLFEEGKEIIFGLFFQGFGYRGEDRALRGVLKTAYDNGIQRGILRILKNVDALYRKREQGMWETNKATEGLCVDEWFDEVYMKAETKKVALPSERTIETPTAESIQKQYERVIARREQQKNRIITSSP